MTQTEAQRRNPFSPKIIDRLKQKMNVTPNFTTILTAHGNIKSYLYKFKIIDDPICLCKKWRANYRSQCELVEKERVKSGSVKTKKLASE